MWDAEILEDGVKFSILSPDGDQGLPGNFKLNVTYTVTAQNGLKITYDGVSDKDTFVSMTNHSYFNLNGENSDSILEHELMIYADGYTKANQEMITTGEIADVTGTAMDFRVAKAIGKDINKEEEPLLIGGGYDHNFTLNDHTLDDAIVRFIQEISFVIKREKEDALIQIAVRLHWKHSSIQMQQIMRISQVHC